MDFKKELEDYIIGETKFTKLLNIFIKDLPKNWYSKIGEHIIKIYNGELPKDLSFYIDFKKSKNKVFKKLDDFIEDKELTDNIGVWFLTSTLDKDVLTKMFGKGLYHNEFGEGFDGEYDEETDDYLEPEIKESFISWFVFIDNVKFHIGVDHRGTSIEVEKNTTPDKVYNCLTKIVDKYKSI